MKVENRNGEYQHFLMKIIDEPAQKKWELKSGLSLLGQYGKPRLPEQEGLPPGNQAPNLFQGARQAGEQGLARGRRERE